MGRSSAASRLKERFSWVLRLIAAAAVVANAPAFAQTATVGAREVPARSVPVPDTVSPQMQKIIAAPLPATWNVIPKTADEWRAQVNEAAAVAVQALPAMRAQLHVKAEPRVIDGVKTFDIVPETIPPQNRNRLLIHVHGGCYVSNPGEAGTSEAILMAGLGGFKVISVDYRMPPEAPYPAALDDAMTVWKAALKMAEPKNMAIFGTSAGGALTLSMVLRAKQDNLPLPGAIASGTRDLLLSNTVRVHRKLREAGVEAVLQVFEGQSHAQYMRDVNAPETKDAFGEIARFLDKHLGK